MYKIYKYFLLKLLKKALLESGFSSQVEYAVLTGSFVLEKNISNDLDLIIVLKKGVSKKNILEKIKKFSLQHIEIQNKFNFKPDWNFPTYFITREQIEDVLSGRPFIKYTNNIYLKKYSLEEWNNDLESDYRVILYQLISHNFDVFFGNSKKLESDTRKALKYIFLFTYNLFGYSSEEYLTKLQLSKSLFFSAGLNYNLTNKLEALLISILLEEKVIFFQNLQDKNYIYLNHKTIISQYCKFKSIFKEKYDSNHIIDWEELNSYIQNNFTHFTIIDKVYNYVFNAKTREEEWENWHQRIKEQILDIKIHNKQPKEITDDDEIRYYSILHDTVIEYLPKKIDNFMEIGSGSGTLSVLLQETFSNAKAYLLDNHKTALEYSSYINKSAEGILANAVNIPFQDDSFDFLYSVGLIEHFDDERIFKMIDECYRVLKPNKILFLAVPNFFSPDLLMLWKKYGKGSEKYISKNKLKKYTEEVGFKTIKIGHLKYVGNFFTKYKLQKIEKFLAENGFGFLNYVICIKPSKSEF